MRLNKTRKLDLDIDIGQWVRRAAMPLVTTDDGSLCFLIDTGASYNVLIGDSYRNHMDDFRKEPGADYLLGMNGEPQRIFIASGEISLGGTEFKVKFGVMELTEALHTVQVITGKRIDGALGVEFLEANKLIIDFAKMRLRSEK